MQRRVEQIELASITKSVEVALRIAPCNSIVKQRNEEKEGRNPKVSARGAHEAGQGLKRSAQCKLELAGSAQTNLVADSAGQLTESAVVQV